MAPPRTVFTVASGDLRLSANVKCWPVQVQLEADLARAVESSGWSVVRGHGFDEAAGHGFIDSQRKGLEVFAGLPPDAPLIVVEAVWQYSHHVLGRVADASRSDLGGGQLERHVPRSRRPVEPDGEFDEGWESSIRRCGVSTSPMTGRSTGLRTWLETGRLVHDVQSCPRPADLGRVRRRSRPRSGVGGAVAAGEGDHRGVR